MFSQMDRYIFGSSQCFRIWEEELRNTVINIIAPNDIAISRQHAFGFLLKMFYYYEKDHYGNSLQIVSRILHIVVSFENDMEKLAEKTKDICIYLCKKKDEENHLSGDVLREIVEKHFPQSRSSVEYLFDELKKRDAYINAGREYAHRHLEKLDAFTKKVESRNNKKSHLQKFRIGIPNCLKGMSLSKFLTRLIYNK